MVHIGKCSPRVVPSDLSKEVGKPYFRVTDYLIKGGVRFTLRLMKGDVQLYIR